MKGVLPISRTKSLKEKAYDILKELILTGRLEQGKLHNEKRLAEVESRIDNLANPTPCEKTFNCKSIPVGHRACGGPKRYAVYSDLSDPNLIEKLFELSKESSNLEKQISQQSFAISGCAMEMPPVLICQARRCVISEE